MSVPYEAKAATGLEQLGLKVAHRHLDQVAQRAAAGRWSYTHFLGYLLDGELEKRRRRSIEPSLQFARFPYRKRLEDFDYAAQVFAGDAVMASAALDRLLHRATVLNIHGDSYRMKDRPPRRWRARGGGLGRRREAARDPGSGEALAPQAGPRRRGDERMT